MLAIYPGSFDPITSGHIDIIERALKIFGGLRVVVMTNPRKPSLFAVDEKLEMIEESLSHLSGIDYDHWEGLLVDYVSKNGVKVVIRGLRALSDFEYEFQMALANKHMCPQVEIVFLMTAAEFSFVSSSLVKEIFQMGGDVSKWVPKPVLEHLKRKLSTKVRQFRI
ncbi:MAG: pantetheine-phosphate adenylyltransferase [Thermotogae bacterium]|nr:pantetheine-phosphate adenylyltransferase [Thermotogota bacterium]